VSDVGAGQLAGLLT